MISSRRHPLLVIDDDVELQRQLAWALGTFEVHCAGTRREAIEVLQRHRPSVVLQDLGLPPDERGVEEGFATIAEVVAKPSNGSELPTLRESRRQAELQAVHWALALTGGNIAKAARMLDVTRPTIYEVMSRPKRSEGRE